MEFSYYFYITNIKFLDKLHQYIESIPNLSSDFYIVKEDQTKFVFKEELSAELLQLLTQVINKYIPPQYIYTTTRTDRLNITIDKINTLEYTTIASDMWINIGNEGVLNIVNVIGNCNSGSYSVKIYDVINNKIISENEFNNKNITVQSITNLQNITRNDTFIEVQVKVNSPETIVNIKSIIFITQITS
jgi:hypothetical protein